MPAKGKGPKGKRPVEQGAFKQLQQEIAEHRQAGLELTAAVKKALPIGSAVVVADRFGEGRELRGVIVQVGEAFGIREPGRLLVRHARGRLFSADARKAVLEG